VVWFKLALWFLFSRSVHGETRRVCWGPGRTNLKEKKKRMTDCVIITLLHPEPFQSHSPMPLSFNPEEKRGKDLFSVLLCAYRFLSIRTSTRPTTTIAMIMAMDIGRMYMSANDAGVGVGAGVDAGSSITVKWSSADENQ
jgi:hypothetical protein